MLLGVRWSKKIPVLTGKGDYTSRSEASSSSRGASGAWGLAPSTQHRWVAEVVISGGHNEIFQREIKKGLSAKRIYQKMMGQSHLA